MNQPAKIMLTESETALVDAFSSRAEALPGNPAYRDTRRKAVDMLASHGLPTRKVEAWHYTDLRRLLADIPGHVVTTGVADVLPLVEGSRQLVVENGIAKPFTSIDNVKIIPMADRLRADVGAQILPLPSADDAIGLINTAFATDGFALQVSGTVDNMIELVSGHAGGQVHTRNRVDIAAGAAASILERHLGSDDAVTASSVTDLSVGDDGNVVWIIVQEQGAHASHLGQLNLSLGKNAKATIFIANFSGKLVRQEVNVLVKGEGADLTFRAINLLGDDTHCDVTLVLDHLVPNTTSNETVRSVVTGAAQGVFQGQIRVAQIAQKTDAQMACNTLLLSDEASFSAKPELEIFADDVICAHGATVAEIDHDHLFYLMARGIPEKQARGLLVQAFVSEIVEELDNEPLIEALETRIEKWLEAHA